MSTRRNCRRCELGITQLINNLDSILLEITSSREIWIPSNTWFLGPTSLHSKLAHDRFSRFCTELTDTISLFTAIDYPSIETHTRKLSQTISLTENFNKPSLVRGLPSRFTENKPTTFRVIALSNTCTHKQTDRQTDKQTEVKTAPATTTSGGGRQMTSTTKPSVMISLVQAKPFKDTHSSLSIHRSPMQLRLQVGT